MLIFLLIAPLSFFKLSRTLENHFLDFCYRLRPQASTPADMLIVAIDEASFQELQRPWPWPRRWHAELVKRLTAAGARLIIFDLIFADATDPEDDRLFAEAMDRSGNVILSQALEETQDPQFTRRILVQPTEVLRRAARQTALSMISPDADGVVRRFRLHLAGQPTLPAAAVEAIPEYPPRPQGLTGLIDYVGPPRLIETVSYYQVLDRERPLPPQTVRNRIVLVGRTLEASVAPQARADTFYTPFFGETGQLMSGVEVQGNILHTLMRGSWIGEFPAPWRIVLYLVILLISSYLLGLLPPLAGLGVAVGLLALFGLGSFALFWQCRVWVPPVLLSGGVAGIYAGHVLGQYLLEAREKRWLRQAFSRYVSDKLVEIITAHPERLALGGEEMPVTILFADLAGFTRFSETMKPQDLILLLNEYFSAMTQVIQAQKGTLDKYIGDALMALWGAPVPLPDHASRACRAALQMRDALAELQPIWQERGLPLVAARTGIHSGPVVAGNVGSRDRFDYTVLGDTVNLASRLEGVNKVYGSRIIISDATAREVDGLFMLRELDQVRVLGREQPVTIYELLAEPPASGPPAWLDRFVAARQAYLEMDWPRALRLFQEVLEDRGEDGPARCYLKRCLAYQEQPPPPGWDGVYVLEGK